LIKTRCEKKLKGKQQEGQYKKRTYMKTLGRPRRQYCGGGLGHIKVGRKTAFFKGKVNILGKKR